MLASDIITGARGTLIDAAKAAWPDADLIAYLAEALSATAAVKPDMYTVRGFITLVAGELQQIPDDGVALIEIDRNSDAAGGRVVTQVDAGLLAECSRFWPAGTKQAQVEHFTADPRTPKRFKVFPPNDGTGVVNCVYGAVPPAPIALTDDVLVSDTYQAPLIAYVLARAYAKSTKRQDLSKTNGYFGTWGQLLGLKSKGQTAVAPKVADSPGLA